MVCWLLVCRRTTDLNVGHAPTEKQRVGSVVVTAECLEQGTGSIAATGVGRVELTCRGLLHTLLSSHGVFQVVVRCHTSGG